jgi:hypothetical protein
LKLFQSDQSLTANITTEEMYCTFTDPVLGMKTSLKRAFSFQTLLVVRNGNFQLENFIYKNPGTAGGGGGELTVSL